MSIWFRRVTGINSEVLRQAASNVNVSWDYQKIQYKKHGVGYANADTVDATKIKDELEQLLGYRPVEIDEPKVDQSN
jgi:hypothetical protein